MDSSKKIKQNQIEDYISNSTQIELNNKVNSKSNKFNNSSWLILCMF